MKVQEALKAAEKLIVKAIMFESEAEQYLTESNYELNGCLGDSAADISVNGKAVLAKVRAALAEIDKCEPVGEVGKSYRDVGGRTASIIWFTSDGDPPPEGTTLYTSPISKDLASEDTKRINWLEREIVSVDTFEMDESFGWIFTQYYQGEKEPREIHRSFIEDLRMAIDEAMLSTEPEKV
jgi:hypothetical protein